MTFATSAEKFIPTQRELVSAIAEVLRTQALPLEWGGTSVRAAGANDTARAQDVLVTWGMLDSGLLVPLARIPTDLPIERVLALDALTTVVRFVTPNTPDASDSGLILRSGIAGSEMFRVVSDSNPEAGGDANVGVNFEPLGLSRTSEYQDPFPTTFRPTRSLFAESNGGVLSRFGIGAPSVSESTDTGTGLPTAIVTLRDANGYYAEYQTDDADNTTCGVGGSELGTLEMLPTFYFVGRSALLNSALFLFAGNADPAAYVSAPFATNGNFGVGLFYDTDMSHTGGELRAVLCSGASISLSITNDVSVNSTGALRRTTGSWITDGVKAGSLLTIGGMGVAVNLSLTGIVSVDSNGDMVRSSGDWTTDNVQVGRAYTIGGTASNNGVWVVLAVSATHITWTEAMTPEGLVAGAVTVVGDNNGAKRCTAVTALGVTFDPLLCTQSTVTGAVTVTNPGQEVFATGLILTANTRFVARIRYRGNYEWDFSVYNFTGRVWESPVKSATSPCTPEPSAILKAWWRLRTNSTTSRKTQPAVIAARYRA